MDLFIILIIVFWLNAMKEPDNYRHYLLTSLGIVSFLGDPLMIHTVWDSYFFLIPSQTEPEYQG